jgi:4-amino-4-deoxy-L-arabinose transferase-like glycosyltransferase
LLAVWALFILVFFSLSHAKLPAYILPVFPALALLIAHYLENASHRAMIIAAGSLAVMGAAILVFACGAPGLALRYGGFAS